MKILLINEILDDEGFGIIKESGYQFVQGTYSVKNTEEMFERLLAWGDEGKFIFLNFEMFDYLEFDSVDDIKRTFRIYQNKKIKRMDKETASNVWEDVEKDFLHVHEILRNKRLI